MIQILNLTKKFPDKTLFSDVNLKLIEGTYGVIGANGAGKSTFLKILSGQVEKTSGEIIIEKGKRISTLEQDHYKYNDYVATEVVIMGHKTLYQIMTEKDALYAKPDFSEEDGHKAAELEEKFATMGGWESEANAQKLLDDLGIEKENWNKKVVDLPAIDKIKILLAKALFGDPDILILDEPTNHLDLESIQWLEEFMQNYKNTIIVVSHDSGFLDNVCTHIIDIDRTTAKLYAGNYSFWKESSELMLKLVKQQNMKKEEQIKSLKAFIARFQANASKSKQATSRKKSMEKIELEEIKPSTRRYPFVNFDINRENGKKVLIVEDLSYVNSEGETLFKNVSFRINPHEKLAIIGKDDISKTKFLDILAGKEKPTTGTVTWGDTITSDYFPSDNAEFFDNDLELMGWLSQFTSDNADSRMRTYLGRMLFSNDNVYKKAKDTSGGEKVRLMFARMMVRESNFLILDQPLNHLDIESIFSTIKGLNEYKGGLIFSTYNKTFISKVANALIDIDEENPTLFKGTLEDYLIFRKNK
ncbi:MAG: ATP-binding cassette domain-containing protein [Mycoplasma sp.]|nr:ATP-binding cassette domain-containing protein [Mycoplasma sp.]